MKSPAAVDDDHTVSQVALELRAMRELAGLSMERLAERLDMKLGTYRHYEERYKKTVLPISFVRQLADALHDTGVTADAIFALAGVTPGMAPTLPGFDDPGGHLPRPLTEAGRRLAALPPAGEAIGPATTPAEEDIRIGSNGKVLQIVATVDRAGLAKLMAKLKKAEALFDD